MHEQSLAYPDVPYRRVDVPVDGGTLRVGIWGESGPAILCSHGITANHAEFQHLAQALGPGVRVIAPDHRGRGRSDTINGPWGMRAHAADMAAVLDHLGIARAELMIGHSMGGFVAAVTAAQYPQRIGALLMVDGGIPLLQLSWVTNIPFSNWMVEKLTGRIIGPALKRLDMSFKSLEDYYAYWRPHPALAAGWCVEYERWVAYDLIGEAPALRSSVRKDALLLDVRTQLIEDLVPRSLKTLQCPVRFLRAERGMFNDKPLYDEKKLVKAAAPIKRFSHVTVPGTNHYTILLSAHGATVAAKEARALL
ncbi:MAG TPA: alpha/beta hydrolase [Verrucomicrobiae bacterium]|nr:alpha/beta hydrolase [Verrucomicrobiae bacterium]